MFSMRRGDILLKGRGGGRGPGGGTRGGGKGGGMGHGSARTRAGKQLGGRHKGRDKGEGGVAEMMADSRLKEGEHFPIHYSSC
jgi:hypothetical protein